MAEVSRGNGTTSSIPVEIQPQEDWTQVHALSNKVSSAKIILGAVLALAVSLPLTAVTCGWQAKEYTQTYTTREMYLADQVKMNDLMTEERKRIDTLEKSLVKIEAYQESIMDSLDRIQKKLDRNP